MFFYENIFYNKFDSWEVYLMSSRTYRFKLKTQIIWELTVIQKYLTKGKNTLFYSILIHEMSRLHIISQTGLLKKTRWCTPYRCTLYSKGIEEGFVQKRGQRTSLLFGGQNLINSLPRLLFCTRSIWRIAWIHSLFYIILVQFVLFFILF